MTEELIKEAEQVAKDGLPNCNTNHEHYESCLTCENKLISMIQALVEALKAEKEVLENLVDETGVTASERAQKTEGKHPLYLARQAAIKVIKGE